MYLMNNNIMGRVQMSVLFVHNRISSNLAVNAFTYAFEQTVLAFLVVFWSLMWTDTRCKSSRFICSIILVIIRIVVVC